MASIDAAAMKSDFASPFTRFFDGNGRVLTGNPSTRMRKGEGGRVKGERYQEALAIIKKGVERLKATPRGDVEEGFTPCAKDQERDARSARRRAEERRVYEAIRAGKKVYDE